MMFVIRNKNTGQFINHKQYNGKKILYAIGLDGKPYEITTEGDWGTLDTFDLSDSYEVVFKKKED